ncbi:hypothetical protein [Saccharothrix coeruleofusca]|uniref:hypothetical protein n=1 Tax=Saccharothrix coeruleofusca TaxID=33919 RepID=UPI00166F782C|nr:hypothetical protein [Saccharothrix coeruleofusca]
MLGSTAVDDRRRVLIVAYDDAQVLDITCPSGALDIANRYGAAPPYAIELGPLGRRAARSSTGIALAAGCGLEGVTGRLDTLVVVGGAGAEDAAADQRLTPRVRRLAARSRRVASVRTGLPTRPRSASSRPRRHRVTGWSGTWRATSPGTWPRTWRPPRWRGMRSPAAAGSGRPKSCGGVSAGIDMALHLASLIAGDTTAEAIRLAVEYDPRPPFDSGDATRATPELKELALRLPAESQV